MQDLASLIDYKAPRLDTAVTLFLSHGLSGTEVALLNELVPRAIHANRGFDIAP